MNLGIDCREKDSLLSPRIVPLLVLVREWSLFKEDAFLQTELVLLLLQGVHAVSGGSDEGPSLNQLRRRLEEIGGQQLAQKFTQSLESISHELTAFMDLFEQLSSLFTPASENSPALLDGDCKQSVLGVFTQHCLSEYKRLTFSQLLRLQSHWKSFREEPGNWEQPLGRKKRDVESSVLDFPAALKELALPEQGRDRGGANQLPSDQELGAEALKLAALHGQFGHKEEGTFALHEAIRLAQQNNKSLMLEHALAWLYQLQPFGGEEAAVVLEKFVNDAEELKQPLLGSWGRLQQAKTQLETAQHPTRVLQSVASSEADFSPIFEDWAKKTAHHCSVLALQAAVWEHYGNRLLGLLYSQLECHMTSCDPCPEGAEAFALCVCTLARHLAEMGKYEKASLLLENARVCMKSTGLAYKILCQSLEELAFEAALMEENFSVAEKHLRNTETFDRRGAMYRKALLSRAEGDLNSAVEQAQQLLQELQKSGMEPENSTQLQANLLTLLAECRSEQGLPAMALPHVVEGVALCKRQHLSERQAALCLAHIQLQLGSPKHCLSLLRDYLLHCQANGSSHERGVAYFLLTQATLGSKGPDHLGKEDVLGVMPTLSEAVASFRRCSAKKRLKEALVLQAQLYNYIGYSAERDKISNCIHTIITLE